MAVTKFKKGRKFWNLPPIIPIAQIQIVAQSPGFFHLPLAARLIVCEIQISYYLLWNLQQIIQNPNSYRIIEFISSTFRSQIICQTQISYPSSLEVMNLYQLKILVEMLITANNCIKKFRWICWLEACSYGVKVSVNQCKNSILSPRELLEPQYKNYNIFIIR